MATHKKKLLTLTVELDTYSTREALTQAGAITDKLTESLPAKGWALKGAAVR